MKSARGEVDIAQEAISRERTNRDLVEVSEHILCFLSL